MGKRKKTSSTSDAPKKMGRPRGRTIKIKVDTPSKDDDPTLAVHPEERPDFEKVAAEPDDEASKHTFPPPRKNPVFRKTWMSFIDLVVDNNNFKEGHLRSLEVLCDLYVEYDELREFVRTHGRTYKSLGRNGTQFKLYPEIDQLNKVQHQIQTFMKMLGLALKDSKDTGNGSDSEKGAWD